MTESTPTPELDGADDDEDDDDRDHEPLDEDAEIDPPGYGEADMSDEVLTPLPGFGGYNPIYGRGGVGAFEGTPAKDVLSGTLPGDVLLEVNGKRTHYGALVLLGVGLVMLLFVPVNALLLPQAEASPGLNAGAMTLLLGGVVLVGAWFLRDLIFETDVDVTFTSEGVARHGKGADAWVRWADVRGYRAPDATFVTLECVGGTVPVPTPDVEAHARLEELLEGRGVPRL